MSYINNILVLLTALILSCSMMGKANDLEKSWPTTSNKALTSSAKKSDEPLQKTTNGNDSAVSKNSKDKITVFEKVKKDPKNTTMLFKQYRK